MFTTGGATVSTKINVTELTLLCTANYIRRVEVKTVNISSGISNLDPIFKRKSVDLAEYFSSHT